MTGIPAMIRTTMADGENAVVGGLSSVAESNIKLSIGIALQNSHMAIRFKPDYASVGVHGQDVSRDLVPSVEKVVAVHFDVLQSPTPDDSNILQDLREDISKDFREAYQQAVLFGPNGRIATETVKPVASLGLYTEMADLRIYRIRLELPDEGSHDRKYSLGTCGEQPSLAPELAKFVDDMQTNVKYVDIFLMDSKPWNDSFIWPSLLFLQAQLDLGRDRSGQYHPAWFHNIHLEANNVDSDAPYSDISDKLIANPDLWETLLPPRQPWLKRPMVCGTTHICRLSCRLNRSPSYHQKCSKTSGVLPLFGRSPMTRQPQQLLNKTSLFMLAAALHPA